MLPEDALREMHVLIATPCYISAVSMNYVTSLYEFTYLAAEKRLQTTLRMHSESLITRGRNEIVAYFLENEQFTHLFWIDSDIAFTPDAALRLLLSDHDVVAGIYPMKNLNWPTEGIAKPMGQDEFTVRQAIYPFNPIGHWDEPVIPRLTADQFIEVAEAPTGFMAIKRQVFTRLIEAYPDLNYMPEGPEKRAKSRFFWLFFDCMVDPESKRYLSEDYAFCKRWRDIGGTVFADFTSDLGHLGQHMYRGNLARSMRLREGHEF